MGFPGIFIVVGRRELAIGSSVYKAGEPNQEVVPFGAISGVARAKKYRFRLFIFIGETGACPPLLRLDARLQTKFGAWMKGAGDASCRSHFFDTSPEDENPRGFFL